jgi:hypothetical protein
MQEQAKYPQLQPEDDPNDDRERDSAGSQNAVDGPHPGPLASTIRREIERDSDAAAYASHTAYLCDGV